MRDAVFLDKVPLASALKAVTANPATLLKLPTKGRIVEHADADLVLADEKTLAIDTVIAKGALMVSGGQLLVKGTFET